GQLVLHQRMIEHDDTWHGSVSPRKDVRHVALAATRRGVTIPAGWSGGKRDATGPSADRA
ncbi:MAG TPA: hypothetical protein VME47_04635, partial [Acetobacteraceae bacterium]|nr:hypothetical protein [Acetobacteraceae bacterium]